MSYEGLPAEILKKANAEVGDTIELEHEGKKYRGVIMPHHGFSAKEILTLKLSSGYNIGIELKECDKLQVIKKGSKKTEHVRIERRESTKPKVSMLSTGGTIASFVDYRTGAVHPALSADELAFLVPELEGICRIEPRVVFSILSENMRTQYWQQLAREVAKEFRNGAEGVIIPHGTDTMGYTAAALSFMLRDLPGPVVLVGAQRSSDRPSSDAISNLTAAAKVAVSDIGEVVVVMHGDISDTHFLVHRGTKVRKMHTSRRDAFRSINSPPIAKIIDDKFEYYIPYKKKTGKGNDIKLDDSLSHKVVLVSSYPGFTPEHFDFLADNFEGIVVAGTGLGHISSDLLPSVQRATSKGVFVVMTSQCLYGEVNMNVYDAGRDLIKAGIIPAGDMLPETAFVKLCWVLGKTKDPKEVRNLMSQNIAGEITDTRHISWFLQ